MTKWWAGLMCLSYLIAIAYSWSQRYDAAAYHMASAAFYGVLAYAGRP